MTQNFATWLYGRSNHPRRNSALKTLAALGWDVVYLPTNQAYSVLDSSGRIRKLGSKLDVLKYLADVTDRPEVI